VPLTASCSNTIAEECILLLRMLYNNKKCIQPKKTTDLPPYFDSLIVLNIISATDYLANPTLEKNVFVSKKYLFWRPILK
jgi:hypothetical protein